MWRKRFVFLERRDVVVGIVCSRSHEVCHVTSSWVLCQLALLCRHCAGVVADGRHPCLRQVLSCSLILAQDAAVHV